LRWASALGLLVVWWMDVMLKGFSLRGLSGRDVPVSGSG